MKIRLVGA